MGKAAIWSCGLDNLYRYSFSCSKMDYFIFEPGETLVEQISNEKEGTLTTKHTVRTDLLQYVHMPVIKYIACI